MRNESYEGLLLIVCIAMLLILAFTIPTQEVRTANIALDRCRDQAPANEICELEVVTYEQIHSD